jgi:hypothetical protein
MFSAGGCQYRREYHWNRAVKSPRGELQDLVEDQATGTFRNIESRKQIECPVLAQSSLSRSLQPLALFGPQSLPDCAGKGNRVIT